MSDVAVIVGGTAVVFSRAIQYCVTSFRSTTEYVSTTQDVTTVEPSGAVLKFLQPQRFGNVFDVFEGNHGVIAMAENTSAGDARSISTCDTTSIGS